VEFDVVHVPLQEKDIDAVLPGAIILQLYRKFEKVPLGPGQQINIVFGVGIPKGLQIIVGGGAEIAI
jgi:hypothetical protein